MQYNGKNLFFKKYVYTLTDSSEDCGENVGYVPGMVFSFWKTKGS